MTSDLTILQSLPSGWYQKKNKESGEMEDTRKNFRSGDLSTLLRFHYETRLRYNLLNLEPEFDGAPIPNDLIENYYVFLSELGYEVSKGCAQDALLVAAQRNAFHPVVKYLEELEANKKVEAIDLNKIATNYLGTNEPLYDSMLKATLIGAVARVFDRGCKFDTCCVLKGSQGIGKSSFWRLLASDDWFCDTWQEKHQDLYMAIQTCWFMEIAELDSMTTKKDQGEIKAILSSSVDTFKRPYARTIGKHPRPSILVGSCNASDFLNDPTGSRRFWIIDLKDNLIDLKKLMKDRERILKAAVLAYRKGEKPKLTDKEQRESNNNNYLYEAENPFQYQIDQWVNAEGEKRRRWEEKYGSNGFTTFEALTESGCRDEKSVKNPDLKMAASALKDLDFEQRNQTTDHGKKVPRKWLRIDREPRQIELS